MVNDVACNDSAQCFILDTQNILQKAYSVKSGWHYKVSYICYLTFIEIDYFPCIKKTTQHLYQNKHHEVCK